ncbi:MAG: U32 family peptidase C-terminal domain-containing protein [Thermodesulfobacteriota bacterium]|nr:U32 family peptidase C-terminal domain-containing protein [Thermodesulfobacteriota bacterium]
MSHPRCELLAPAGSLEKLKIAIHYGADAVYLGGKRFSLRAQAANFKEDELREAIDFAHQHGARVFVTVNIFAHNRDFKGLADYLNFLAEIRVDGLIISDPGILSLARKTVPQLKIHLSTQANVTNGESASFWEQQGVSRINLARELSLAEIREIKNKINAKIEVFVHGALCISYSGRCMLSLYLTGRDANKGLCAHPCRYSYRLEEAKRPGQFFAVEEDERGTHIFNSKDLCLIKRLPELIAAGVDSIKIEGRMKGIYYAGGIVRIYRAALDHVYRCLEENPAEPVVMGEEFMEEIVKLGSRGYTENFLDGPPDVNDMLYPGPRVDQIYVPALLIRKKGSDTLFDIRHKIEPGDRLEYMDQGLANLDFKIKTIYDLNGSTLEQAQPNTLVRLETIPEIDWQEHGLVRKVQN